MSLPKIEHSPNKREVNWLSIAITIQIFVGFWFCFYIIFKEVQLLTSCFALILIVLGLLGQTAGSHRLWCHHSYKANIPLRLFLMFFQTFVGSGSIYKWVRLHRLHHKYFKTDLDPFNVSKGFVYSHFINDLLSLSPKQVKALDEIDMSDLEQDKIVMFQKHFYWILLVICTILLPINAPVEYWNETIQNSVLIVGIMRFGLTYQLSLLIHSATNVFELNAEDGKNLYESNLIFFINKSHWLSYHYLAPWDYQASEFGKYGTDCTSKFIRVCAALEMASDLRTTDSEIIRNALIISTDENKPLSQCLSMMNKNLLKEHDLTSTKLNC